MAGPAWTPFLGSMALLAGLVVVLARRTAVELDDPESPIADLPRRAVYLNVILSHGLVSGAVLLATWLAGVSPSSLGAAVVPAAGQAIALFLALLVLNEGADRLLGSGENALRALLTPERPAGWVTLAVLVLPTVAATEELLFRGVLIGAASVGTELPPALLVLGSGVLFGAAHSAQGVRGIVAATVLGLLLGGAFHLTGSLLLVILVHYALDLVEFLVHRNQASPSSSRQY